MYCSVNRQFSVSLLRMTGLWAIYSPQGGVGTLDSMGIAHRPPFVAFTRDPLPLGFGGSSAKVDDKPRGNHLLFFATCAVAVTAPTSIGRRWVRQWRAHHCTIDRIR